jgi:hypothetical protein
MWLFLISVTLMVLGVALRATREGRVS